MYTRACDKINKWINRAWVTDPSFCFPPNICVFSCCFLWLCLFSPLWRCHTSSPRLESNSGRCSYPPCPTVHHMKALSTAGDTEAGTMMSMSLHMCVCSSWSNTLIIILLRSLFNRWETLRGVTAGLSAAAVGVSLIYTHVTILLLLLLPHTHTSKSLCRVPFIS